MSVAAPLLDTIEADEPAPRQTNGGAQAKSPKPVVLTPSTRNTSGTSGMANTEGDAENGTSTFPFAFLLSSLKCAGIGAIFRQVWSLPVSLLKD